MSLYALVAGNGPSGFGYGSTAEDVSRGLDLQGKRYLVTGATSGIGQETARVLALRGATVICAARSTEKAAAAAAAFTGGGAIPLACELSDPASVRAAAASLVRSGEPLDGIVCNAGIMALPTCEQAHGYELQFFTNHIGHFLLVTSLLPLLAADGRVVMVSSNAHRRTYPEGIRFDDLAGNQGYTPWGAYGQSKLCNLLFARELARRFGSGGQLAFSLHPGVIATNLGRHLPLAARFALAAATPLFLKSVEQGAATQTWAAVHPHAAKHNGAYLSHSNPAEPTAHGKDDAMATRLWAESERIVASL